MRVFEITLAVLLGLGGIRSLMTWMRRPFLSPSFRDHVLYALWVTGRAGMWFAIAGVFVISALINARGKAFTDEFRRYQWYIFVPLGLAALQVFAGFLLGRGQDRTTPTRRRG